MKNSVHGMVTYFDDITYYHGKYKLDIFKDTEDMRINIHAELYDDMDACKEVAKSYGCERLTVFHYID